MNEENTKKLMGDFPEFFKHTDNMMESLMCFGFEYDDGWMDLTYKLCKDIKDYFIYIDSRHKIPEYFYVVQCKEKFGGLRFYITTAPKQVFEIINKAEDKSYKICEICGKKGILRNKLPWWRTLCLEHYRESLENIRRKK